MAQSPLREKNKTQWWNVDFSHKYNYSAFCKVLYCIKQSGITLESWQGEKYTQILMSGYFILTFSLVKSFCLPFAKQWLLYRYQSGSEFSHWGLKTRRVILQRTPVTPWTHVTAWCQSRLLHFSGFSFKLDQTSETTFRYQQSQYADCDASVKKASDQDLWSEATLCVKSDTCLINGEMKCQISLWEDACVF